MQRLLVFLASVLLLTALGAAAFGESRSLATTTNSTIVDGVVNPAEYSVTQSYDQMTLYFNRTASTLYVAAVGDTTGWVAVGLGSLRMDGSTIFMGFVGSDGKVQFKPQSGSGHSHRDDPRLKGSIVSYAMAEKGGKTTLELALKPSDYIKDGQGALKVIYAVGTEKSFYPRHFFRGWLTLPLAK